MKSLVKDVCVCALVLGTGVVCAQETAQEAEKPAGEEKAAVEQPKKSITKSISFSTLPFCRIGEGAAEVLIPGGEWARIDVGRFYPLGSSFRTRDGGRLVLSFGGDSEAEISGDASFSTRAQAITNRTRTLILETGTVSVNLPATMPEGAFFVTSAGFTVSNAAGESRYTLEKTAYGERSVIRCVTGSLALSGRHFEIPKMDAANELVLLDEHDHLVTILENTSGDYLVRLDQGERQMTQVSADGVTETKIVADKTEIKLFPKMKVNIHRALASVGGRVSVFIMAFDAAGVPMGPGVSFCEGRSEISSGMLVEKQATESEELAKKAAEATETTDAPAEDAGEGASSEKKEKPAANAEAATE